MKTAIINADDLGLCSCVNRGIARAHREGILTSATLMANTPGFDEGVQVARDHPNLGIGVHLNIVRGKPLAAASTVRPLLSPLGNFQRVPARLSTAYLNAAEVEYRAQIERILAAGIHPTHVDFEKHHARVPSLYRLASHLAQEYGILAIRSLKEPVWLAGRCLPWPGLKAIWTSALLRVYVTLANYPKSPARPACFFGQTHIGNMTGKVWEALLSYLPDGVSEIMCHPGEYDEAELQRLAPEIGDAWLARMRPLELAGLTAPATKEAAKKIHLATFAILGKVGDR